MSIIFYIWIFFIRLKYYSKDTTELGVGRYHEKIRLNLLSKNYEPITLEALLELKEEGAVVGVEGQFFLGPIDVTTSEYCQTYQINKCPRAGTNWKECFHKNNPCKNFRYIPVNGKT